MGMSAAPARQSPAAALYAERKAASQCLWCGIPAAPDSAYCLVHRDIVRRQQADRYKRIRAERRRNGMCGGCGARKSKTFWCSECRPKSDGVNNGVVNPEPRVVRPSATKQLVVEADGWFRQRYKGRDKGPPTRLETDEWDMRSIEAEISRARGDMLTYWSAENQAQPRIQREASKRSALGHLELAQRFLDDLVDRTGKGLK
jgi:hypothetical protein